MTPMADVTRFFATQSGPHHSVFPVVPRGTLIGFLGTTASGSGPTFGVSRIADLRPAQRGKGVEVSLQGSLPREPGRDENVSACLVDLARYRGYQIKSTTSAGQQVVEAPDGGAVLDGRSVYTVHHSPNVLNVFETIPFADMARDLATVQHAVLAVGPRANISPRFIFHHEEEGDGLRLFHGDGLVHKTYLNLRENPQMTYLVCDPTSYQGLSLRGTCEEQPPDAPGEGQDRVRAGFAALGFELSKIFVTHVSKAEPVAV